MQQWKVDYRNDEYIQLANFPKNNIIFLQMASIGLNSKNKTFKKQKTS